MSVRPITITEIFDASVADVWFALTNKTAFDKWYFDIEHFEAIPGFEFEFYGGSYLHHCKIIEVIPNKKISYSWVYPVYKGESVVTFELSELKDEFGPQTTLLLTHEGVESFPPDDENFSRDSFVAGWEEIIRIALKNYVENISSEKQEIN